MVPVDFFPILHLISCIADGLTPPSTIALVWTDHVLGNRYFNLLFSSRNLLSLTQRLTILSFFLAAFVTSFHHCRHNYENTTILRVSFMFISVKLFLFALYNLQIGYSP